MAMAWGSGEQTRACFAMSSLPFLKYRVKVDECDLYWTVVWGGYGGRVDKWAGKEWPKAMGEMDNQDT